jgi:hypothetical protein
VRLVPSVFALVLLLPSLASTPYFAVECGMWMQYMVNVHKFIIIFKCSLHAEMSAYVCPHVFPPILLLEFHRNLMLGESILKSNFIDFLRNCSSDKYLINDIKL